MLYHYTTHPALRAARVGQVFALVPGKQCAEGLGVYFAEEPRLQAADAIASGKECTGCVVIARPESQRGWWVTKLSQSRKFNKPRTWHTAGRSLTLTVTKIDGHFIHCEEQ